MALCDVHVTDFTKDGKCSRCGQCCSNALPLAKWQVDRIAKYIAKHNIKQQRHNAMIGFDMTCPFRDEAKRICTIYEVRPEICREFMCNHTTEDIMKAKIDMHQRKEVVMMRGRFFRSSEEQDMFEMFLKALTGQGD